MDLVLEGVRIVDEVESIIKRKEMVSWGRAGGVFELGPC
jgi:hypothetical protein